MVALPRLVIAAPASGAGKTTVASGIMAALARRGRIVAPFKVGPDYIDPGYHAVATGRPGRNLDPYLCGAERVIPLLIHGSRGADVAVIEGAMGLYDGRLGTRGEASSAHVAALTGAPVVLVADARHTGRSLAAVVLGMATFDAGVHVAGVVLNHVGSPRHESELRSSMAEVGMPVLGAVPRGAVDVAPSRHLGLVPAAERDESGVISWALAIEQYVDLDQLEALAATAPELHGEPWSPQGAVGAAVSHGSRPVVAVAGGRAFTFRYAETEELLSAAGLTPVVFDPTEDQALPGGTCGLYLGGGFPEEHAEALADNAALRHAIADAAADGLPMVAECAGYLYLCESLDGRPMAGVLPARAAMTPRLTMGYREAVAPVTTLLAAAGQRVRGHEFHRTAVTPTAEVDAAWQWADARDGMSADPAGAGTPTVHASYLHTHWAGRPALASRFAAVVHARSEKEPS